VHEDGYLEGYAWWEVHGGRCLVYSLMDAMEVQGGLWLGGGGAENSVVANEER